MFGNDPEMQEHIRNLEERRERLNNAYRAYLKELKYEPLGNCDILTNILKDLKELQEAIQGLRNAARSLLETIRQSSKLNSKNEAKLVDGCGDEVVKHIDKVIDDVIIPALKAVNAQAREERGKGIIGSPNARAL
jgi:hypothetical protein